MDGLRERCAPAIPASDACLATKENFLQRDGTTQGSVSAGLAAANAAIPAPIVSGVRFPGEDAGRSLAEMAQCDLDAALQLLADRAQYITGANGAAIALRRSGKQDLLCRASIGPNAPELGALLSTEFGLSGESVRTRKALRCDDAERDARVNRDVCRQLGIASVVVMPVVHDDEVLGVFELFSGKAHAFGERDLSALERLSEMVETAVRLARAAEQVPEPLIQGKPPVQAQAAPVAEATTASAPQIPLLPSSPSLAVPVAVKSETNGLAKPAAPKKLLLWSAPVHAGAEVQARVEPDRTLVPPVLRSLRKCEVCGFPISAGRALCVECEEKRWRGQLKRPQTFPFPAGPSQTTQVQTVIPAAAPAATGAPSARALAAAATQSGPVAGQATLRPATPVSSVLVLPDVTESKTVTATAAITASVGTVDAAPAFMPESSPSPPFTLSAGLEPQQSWFSANKYILGAILVIAGTVAAVLLLR